MKRAVQFFLAVLCISAPLAAGEFVVAYVDGVLEVRDGDRWTEVFIGDAVKATDQIRLGPDSYAELAAGRTTVRLSRAGVYDAATFVDGAARTETVAAGRMVLNRVGRLTGRDDAPQQTAAGGVRAAEVVAQASPDWAGGETVDELILHGVELLADGAFEDAYRILQEAWEYAVTDDEYARALFYYGYAASLAGRILQAFDLLEEIGPLPETPYYAAHVLALGQMLVESYAYEEAIGRLEVLDRAAGESDADRQSARLLLGIAYHGLGDQEQARSYLDRARTTVPGTPEADAAERLLKDL